MSIFCKTALSSLTLFAIALSLQTAYATEPTNLQTTKAQLIAYHDTGAYDEDIALITYQASDYLRTVVAQNPTKKLAIVFDIDETVLSNYKHMNDLNFGGTFKEIDTLVNQGDDPAIPATLALYQQARQENVHVFFITGRTDTKQNHANTARNLSNVGMGQYDALILKPVSYHEKTVSIYKANERKKIIDQGYDIVFTMGDQISDLAGGYADRQYKLPNPYYFIP